MDSGSARHPLATAVALKIPALLTVNGDGASAGYSITEEGDYVIEVQDNATGCLDSHELHVEVLPNLGVDANARETVVCIGDSTLVEVDILSIQGTNPNDLPFSVVWSVEGFGGLENHVGVGEYIVTVTNACGSSTDMVVVEDEYCGCNVWVPNAFTPDGDGSNDTWDIDDLVNFPDAVIEVYDRWGQSVYRSVSYPEPWNGTLRGSGPPVPEGTYYYVINLNDLNVNRPPLTGHVAIIR